MLSADRIKGKIICVYGPTASFKSKFAVELAQQVDGVIINADSMQVYEDVSILTSQPTNEEKNIVPHELYNIIQPTDRFSVNGWLQLAVRQINHAIERGLQPILVGGTGLYFSSIIKGIAQIPEITSDTKNTIKHSIEGLSNEETHNLLARYDHELAIKLRPNDKIRILRGLEVVIQTGKSILEWQKLNTAFFNADKFFKIYLCPPRETLYDNINKRFFKMLDDGVVDEVNNVFTKHEEKIFPKIIGLSTIHEHILGQKDFDAMVDEVQTLTRNYAKRQYTWFNNQLTHDLCKDSF